MIRNVKLKTISLSSQQPLAVLLLALLVICGCDHSPKKSVDVPQTLTGIDSALVLIPAGTFAMGSDKGEYDEVPVHTVSVDSFYISKYELTNAEFAAFVKATRYVTDAEKGKPVHAYIKGASDWQQVTGFSWQHPEGDSTSIIGKEHHPVVCVSWNDAAAYAAWRGGRLPTEAEWEYASRGGLVGKKYNWGDTLGTQGIQYANYWQGTWPDSNKLEDKFFYTAPVGSFKPNGFGLYDMAGNVWEWCADFYHDDFYKTSPAKNPRDTVPNANGFRTARGGSWYCAENTCKAYNNSYRGRSIQFYSFNNVGFRIAKSIR
jgi:sulfatase modifying factor 1